MVLRTSTTQTTGEQRVLWRFMKRYKIYELVGDRGAGKISIKDYAFTIASNPMSDRVQKVIEIHD